MGAYFSPRFPMRLLTSALVAFALLAPALPAAAAEAIDGFTVEAPTELPCGGTSDRARARCITDALKAWKELEHDYNDEEDAIVDAWKSEHSTMGVGSDYQKALRDFLNQIHDQRKEFQKQLQAFRKEFFAEQKDVRMNAGPSAKPKPAPKLPAMTVEEAKAKCGPEDDDGLYRTCMRQLLRGVPSSVTKRSRSSNALLGK